MKSINSKSATENKRMEVNYFVNNKLLIKYGAYLDTIKCSFIEPFGMRHTCQKSMRVKIERKKKFGKEKSRAFVIKRTHKKKIYMKTKHLTFNSAEKNKNK